MSKKNAAIGNASPTSRAGEMYGEGDPSNQTQRSVTMAKIGTIFIIRMILQKETC
jgi:hypothetical protein